VCVSVTRAAVAARGESVEGMDWADSTTQAAFREEVRSFIAQELPARYRPDGEGPMAWNLDRHSDDPERKEISDRWVRALAERGWIAPAWPREYGGAGLTPMEQFIFNHEMARAWAPQVGGQEIAQIGPAIIIHGDDHLKEEHLPRILSGESNWCQGFSEPGSGSDLASLQTRGERRGDDYVINGQKIWTSNAHRADYIAMLVRTDPTAPKHRGISFLIADMRSPGISVRPLVNMGWTHGFNEVFFEDVHVPVSNRVGEENRGWYVSVTLMDFERSRIRQAVSARRALANLLEYLETDVGRARSRLSESTTLRHDLANRAIEIEVAFNLAFRVVSMQASGVVPNHEASMLQMTIFETNQRMGRTEAALFGMYTNVWNEEGEWSTRGGAPAHGYVSSVSATIAGGTSEIQRNIIATRGLGLPRG
jgi:alkylation response protein AidB-like acyl-CoA dehydrogenase